MNRSTARIAAGLWTLTFMLAAAGIGLGGESMAAEPLKVTVARGTANAFPQPAIALKLDLYKEVGLDVDDRLLVSGRESLKTILGGQATFAMVAATPLALAAFHEQGFAIIAENGSCPKFQVVGKKSAGVNKPEDLKGKRLGTSLGSDAEFLMYGFLKGNKLSEQDVKIMNVGGGDMVTSLQTGAIDAFASWQPNPWKASQELKDDAVIMESPAGELEARYFIITTKKIAEENPEAVRRFLKAMLMADDVIRNDPEKAMAIVAADLQADPALVKAIWPTYRYGARLDPALITEFEKCAVWAKEKGYVNAKAETPAYRTIVLPDFLKALAPEAVTLQ